MRSGLFGEHFDSALCRSRSRTVNFEVHLAKNNFCSIRKFSFRTSLLICQNALMALGGIGVWLVDVQGTADAVLQIFQQKFAMPPSPLDAIIVDQLSEMILAGCVSVSLSVSKISCKNLL